MDNCNHGFASSASIKPQSLVSPSFKDAGGKKSNNENQLNPVTASKLKSPGKKQLPPKNFMSPTISAANKASVHKKKILGERNETIDDVEQNSLQRSSSFGSRSVKSTIVDSDDDVEKDCVVKPCLEPYDPITNYLSPRPKFLRYNPNRRGNIYNLQENDDDRVKISTYFGAGNGVTSSGSQLGLGSSVSSDSCPQHESAEEAHGVSCEEEEDEHGEECEDEDGEDETDETEDDRFFSLKGLFKFFFVVTALILTTQAICSMNSPNPSQTRESVWGIQDWHDSVHGFNFSEVGYDLIREPDLLLGRLKEGDVYGDYDRPDSSEAVEEFVEVQNGETHDYIHQDDAENDESGVAQDEIFQEHETEAERVVETAHVEAVEVYDFNHDDTELEIEEDDCGINEENSQLNDAELEITDAMEDGAEKEIRFTSSDLTMAVLILNVLILASFSAIYRSKSKKIRKEEFKILEPSANSESVTPQEEEEEEEEPFVSSAPVLERPPQNDISKEISQVHTPSVELLSEFVFCEEITSTENYSTNSSIQTTNVSYSQTNSSTMETFTEEDQTAKKQRRKNRDVVTISPVRRSSRLKTRSIMSP